MGSTILLMANAAGASSVSVLGGAAAFGSFGARFALASACSSQNYRTVTAPSGTEDACVELTADGTVSTATTLKAGERVILANGFKVNSGTPLSVVIDSALDGNSYLQDNTPNNETTYAARFYVDSGGLGFSTDGDTFEHFVALDSNGNPVFKVFLTYDTSAGNEVRVFLEVYTDGGGTVTNEGTDEGVLSAVVDTFDWVEVGWTAASGDGANDGEAYLSVNGAFFGTFASLDTDLKTVDSVRWGVIDVNDQLSGSVDVDQFESQRATMIGEYVAP